MDTRSWARRLSRSALLVGVWLLLAASVFTLLTVFDLADLVGAGSIVSVTVAFLMVLTGVGLYDYVGD